MDFMTNRSWFKVDNMMVFARKDQSSDVDTKLKNVGIKFIAT